MSNFISVTGIEQKSQSSIDWKALTGTLAFDVNDICDTIKRDAGNTYSYFDINPIKDDSKSTGSKQQYRVSDSLAAIANQSTGLVRLSVTSRRGTTVSYTAVFVASKMSQRLEVVPGGGSSTRFWYNEDGDALPVEYIVSDTIASIIAQTNSSIAFLVRNGLSLTGGYIELGGTLIKNTDIDLDQYTLSQSSAYNSFVTLYEKAHDYSSDSINDGVDRTINRGMGTGFGLSSFGLTRQVVNSTTIVNFVESFDDVTGYVLGTNTGLGFDIYLRVNPLNANQAGAIESPPTYAYTPVEVGTDRVVAINNSGEFYNTGILPSDLALKADVVGLWDDRGGFDASVNAYPSSGGSGTAGAILKGDIWTVTVAGTLPTAQVVEIGDTVRALIDTPGNTQANWSILQNNIGYTAENSANKDTDVALAANSDTLYASQKAVKTYIDTADATKMDKNITLNSQAGANYDLVLTDNNKIIEMTNAAANTLGVPTNASVAFPIGAQILGYQSGAGQTTVTPAGGVTIISPGGRTKTSAQYSSYSLVKVATNTWLLSGDITT